MTIEFVPPNGSRSKRDPASGPLIGFAPRPSRGLPEPVLAHLAHYGEAWEQHYPHRLGTRDKVSTHEVGHGIVSTAVGFGFQRAEIHRLERQSNPNECWSGTFISELRLCNLQVRTPEAIFAEGCVFLAGLAAGAMLADADPMNHPVELLNAAHLAHSSGKSFAWSFETAFSELCAYTVRVLAFHSSDVQTLADRLARKERIAGSDRKVARVLRRVEAMPSRAVPPAPEQERAFARHLDRVPVDLAAFVRGVDSAVREASR